MKHLILCAAALAFGGLAQAQPRGFGGFGGNQPQTANQNATANRGMGGVFPLPQGVNRVISVDPYNSLLVESEDDDGKRRNSVIVVRHIYSGGLALLFGGFAIPTQIFVSPGQNGFGGQGGFGGGNGGGGFNGGGQGNNFGGGQQNQNGFAQGNGQGNQTSPGFNNAVNGGFFGR